MKCPKELLRTPERDYKKELQIMTRERDFWEALALASFTIGLLCDLIIILF